MPHGANTRLLAQPFGHSERVRDVAVHPHGQRLDAQQQQERVEGRERRAEVAQRLRAQLHQQPVDTEGLVELEAVVRRRRVGDGGEAPVRPVEGAGVDDGACDRRPVARDELRRGVHHNVRAVPQRLGRCADLHHAHHGTQ